jgi:hypothetical protein
LLLGAGTSSNEHLKSSGRSTLALGVAGPNFPLKNADILRPFGFARA